MENGPLQNHILYVILRCYIMCSSVITLMLQLVELEQISTTLNAASLIYNDISEFIS